MLAAKRDFAKLFSVKRELNAVNCDFHYVFVYIFDNRYYVINDIA